jgi:hypothetical protein
MHKWLPTNNLGRICCGSQLSGRDVVLLWLVDRTRSNKIHYGDEGVWAHACNYPLRGSSAAKLVGDSTSRNSTRFWYT